MNNIYTNYYKYTGSAMYLPKTNSYFIKNCIIAPLKIK